VTTSSTGVLIAVTDTGIDYLHPDFVGNVWTNADKLMADHYVSVPIGMARFGYDNDETSCVGCTDSVDPRVAFFGPNVVMYVCDATP